MREEVISQARILIVDDQQANVRYLERILAKNGANQVIGTTDSREALPLFAQFTPDLIILDLMMPHMDGFEVMSKLQPLIPPWHYIPILVLTADITPEAKRRALEMGAMDFLTKPFDATEVMLRIKNLLQTRFLHLQLQNQNRTLEEKVLARTLELEDSQLEVLERLALAAEYRDDDTGRHTQRVGFIAECVARELGLPDDQVRLISRAAPLHDVGKIGIPDDILLKPSKLTPAEFEMMKSHTIIGARILSRGRSELIRTAQLVALTHHENWDGGGYPHGRVGEAIPLPGRIVAAVDVLDALTHQRPYKAAWTMEQAVEEITSLRGTKFDPDIVDALLRVIASGNASPQAQPHYAEDQLPLPATAPAQLIAGDLFTDTWLSDLKDARIMVTSLPHD